MRKCAFAMAADPALVRLGWLLDIRVRNELLAAAPDRLPEGSAKVLDDSIMEQLAALGWFEVPAELVAERRALVANSPAGDNEKAHRKAKKELEEVLARVGRMAAHGPRALYCDPSIAPTMPVVEKHIHQYTRDVPYPPWDAEDAGEGKYSLAFLEQGDADWYRTVAEARRAVDSKTYFEAPWSIVQIERLRMATIRQFYADAEPAEPAGVEAWTNAHLDALAREGRLGDDELWRGYYKEAIWAAYYDNAEDKVHPPTDQRLARQKEEEDRKGEANDLFVWRLVVLHLRMLRLAEERAPAATDVTRCFDMDALVQNVAHLLKYRRCIKWSKCLYKTHGVGSPHDQYRGGLLNKRCAHEHKDQSDTEVGIARRIIRQAHVSNQARYKHPKPRSRSRPERADIQADSGGDIYRTESYLVNPPMAPIFCTAPPGMDVEALSLLMASFAVKLGGTVLYGVAPNKVVPKKLARDRLQGMRWSAQKMAPGSIRIYAHQESADVFETTTLLHELANHVGAWVLHIRDRADLLARHASKTKEDLENGYPLFYGLNMCVSATLLPTMGLEAVVGSDRSIRELFAVCRPDVRITQEHRAQWVVLQSWSFPIGPDSLVPPRTHFHLRKPLHRDDAVSRWYLDFYGNPSDRTTHYYGTWLHIGAQVDAPTLLGKGDVVLDDALKNLVDRNSVWVKEALGQIEKERGGEVAHWLSAAFETYLKNFNHHSTRYWNEAIPAFQFGAPPRVANAPLMCLTDNAGMVVHQMQTWLERGPRKHGNDLLHPMLLASPNDPKTSTTAHLEWAMLFCKVAWLHMHKDYVRGRIRRDVSEAELVKRYGVVVLVHATEKTPDRFANLVAKPEDIHVTDQGQIVAITFDPRLAENRFRNHVFTSLPEGRLQPSCLVPTLAREDFVNYQAAFDQAQKDGRLLSAYAFLRDGYASLDPSKSWPGIRSKLYRFDMRRCYPRGSCAQDPPVVLGADGNVRADNSAQDANYPTMPAQAANRQAMGGVSAEALARANAASAPAPPTVESRENSSHGSINAMDEDDAWEPPPQYATEPAPLPNADSMINDCTPSDNHPDRDAPTLTDLNGIALRLSVQGFETVQEATEATLTRCGICKVATVGPGMLTVGALNSTVVHNGESHHFVPQFMSLALDESAGRDQSLLYQSVGRGFVDMGTRLKLPANWELNLLATEGTRELCKRYGNAELLLSQIAGESTEGRKMTLGTALASMPNYLECLNQPLKGSNTAKDENLVMPREVLSVDADYRRPFRNVRDCLSGAHAPKERKVDDVDDVWRGALEGLTADEDGALLEAQGDALRIADPCPARHVPLRWADAAAPIAAAANDSDSVSDSASDSE